MRLDRFQNHFSENYISVTSFRYEYRIIYYFYRLIHRLTIPNIHYQSSRCSRGDNRQSIGVYVASEKWWGVFSPQELYWTKLIKRPRKMRYQEYSLDMDNVRNWPSKTSPRIELWQKLIAQEALGIQTFRETPSWAALWIKLGHNKEIANITTSPFYKGLSRKPNILLWRTFSEVICRWT